MREFNQEIDYLNLKRCCVKYLSLESVFKELNVRNIPYAHIKGETISLYSYGKYGKRTYGDIDILISRKNLRVLESILAQNGYVSSKNTREERILMMSASHQTSSWHKITNCKFNSVVDVNFDVFWGEYTGKRFDIDDFVSDAIEINIYGIPTKILKPLKAIVQLTLHHYKEMNSIYHLAGHNCINYGMFEDIYYFWKTNKEMISLDNLYKISYDYGIISYVFYILYFTNQIYKDLELQEYVDAFRTQDGVDLLDCYGLTEKERKIWKVDFKTRLETKNLFSLIKNDLTVMDFEKIDSNRRIFGK